MLYEVKYLNTHFFTTSKAVIEKRLALLRTACRYSQDKPIEWDWLSTNYSVFKAYFDTDYCMTIEGHVDVVPLPSE